eukprot:gene23851-biopygen23857
MIKKTFSKPAVVARSPRNSIFGGSLARGLVPWPGGWWCLAGPGVSRGASKAAAFLGPDGQKIEKNDHASSNPDLKSGVIPILLGNCSQFPSARLAPRAGPGPRQSQGSARAGAGQSVGQSHCRAWQQLAAARGHHGGCIPGSARRGAVLRSAARRSGAAAAALRCAALRWRQATNLTIRCAPHSYHR